MALDEHAITIKRYANERLYCPAAGRYLSLEDLAEMVEDEEGFVIYDAKSGMDITRSVLRDIIIVGRAGHG